MADPTIEMYQDLLDMQTGEGYVPRCWKMSPNQFEALLEDIPFVDRGTVEAPRFLGLPVDLESSDDHAPILYAALDGQAEEPIPVMPTFDEI